MTSCRGNIAIGQPGSTPGCTCTAYEYDDPHLRRLDAQYIARQSLSRAVRTSILAAACKTRRQQTRSTHLLMPMKVVGAALDWLPW
eukprot:3363106-Pyramimonas_sp.AAC.1